MVEPNKSLTNKQPSNFIIVLLQNLIRIKGQTYRTACITKQMYDFCS
uniref:Uncharacterized protein n=1 Tax=Rhizophora mucronata TaxID=61149 RepID=A0A2P2PR16_RHIMU